MEVLLLSLFFLVILVFFVAGKDDYGRKEIKLKSDHKEEVKNDLKNEPKEEINEEGIKNNLKNEPKEEVKKEVE
tara:strand:- start:167 stop:388 length:222 start_codon:yes stop_codon:yes gene_type:complete